DCAARAAADRPARAAGRTVRIAAGARLRLLPRHVARRDLPRIAHRPRAGDGTRPVLHLFAVDLARAPQCAPPAQLDDRRARGGRPDPDADPRLLARTAGIETTPVSPFPRTADRRDGILRVLHRAVLAVAAARSSRASGRHRVARGATTRPDHTGPGLRRADRAGRLLRAGIRRGRDRFLPVLRAAQLRRRAIPTQGGLELPLRDLPHDQPVRHAALDAMVLRQPWLPPRASRERADSVLSPRRSDSRDSGSRARAAHELATAHDPPRVRASSL